MVVRQRCDISLLVQEAKSLQQNRKLARRWLQEKVDRHVNGAHSAYVIADQRRRWKQQQQHEAALRRLQMKRNFKKVREDGRQSSGDHPEAEEPH